MDRLIFFSTKITSLILSKLKLKTSFWKFVLKTHLNHFRLPCCKGKDIIFRIGILLVVSCNS